MALTLMNEKRVCSQVGQGFGASGVIGTGVPDSSGRCMVEVARDEKPINSKAHRLTSRYFISQLILKLSDLSRKKDARLTCIREFVLA